MPLRARYLAVLLLAASCSNAAKPDGAAASASASASAAPLADFEAPTPSASAAPSAAPSASAAPEKAKPQPRRGLAGELFTRARALALSDEQKGKLDGIEERVWGSPKDEEETRVALKELFAVVLEGVKTGHVVETKLHPHYATLERIAKARRESEAVALNELHDLLEPEQRKELVEALGKKYPSAAEKAAKAAKAPKPAKPPAAAEKSKTGDKKARRHARVTSLLGLDEKQQQRVTPILARFDAEPKNKATREAREKRMRALILAFAKDDFDATKLELGRGPKARMSDRVAFIIELLAILRVDQREKLARTLERPGAKRWGAAVAGDAAPVEED